MFVVSETGLPVLDTMDRIGHPPHAGVAAVKAQQSVPFVRFAKHGIRKPGSFSAPKT